MDSDAARLAVAFAFGERYRADLAAGVARTASEYAALYPGYEDLVAAEFDRLAAPRTYAPTAAERSDVARAPGPASFAAPRRLGPYRLERELGRGGQGAVYLAVDERLGRRVALKILSAPWTGGSDALRRFEQEARTLAALDHPGLCAVHEASTADGLPYIAMRYVEGETLAARFASRNGAPDGVELAFATHVVERVARAVHAAHEAGYVHRDLKPANVMLAADGSPVVLDFGLARGDAGPELTATGDMIGTPAYMAPEQAAGDVRAIGRRTDVHALGAILYEAVVGARPFPGANAAAVLDAVRTAIPADPRAANRRITADLRTVLLTALAKNPADRYATALDFAEDLRRARLFEPIKARPISVFGRLLRWSRRRPAAAALAAVLALFLPTLLAFGGWILAKRPIVEQQERAQRAAAIENALTDAFGALRFDAGAWDRIRAAFAAVLRLDPGNEEAHCGLARAEAESGRGAEALTRLRAIAASDAASPLVRRTESEVLRRLGRAAEADAILAVLPPPTTAIECYFEGLRCAGVWNLSELENGTEGEEIVWFQQAIERAPRFRAIYLDALAHAAGGTTDKALAERVAAAARLQVPGRNGRMMAGFALRTASPAAAVAEFERARGDGPAPYVDFAMAGAYLLEGRTAEGIAAMRRYAEARRDDATAFMSLADVETVYGDAGEAERAARRATELRPDLAAAWKLLAESQRRNGAPPEKFLASLAEANRLAPSDPDVYLRRAAALRELGREDEAILDAQEAVKLAPKRADARAEFGRCLLGRDAPRALREFEAASELAPRVPDYPLYAAVAAQNLRDGPTALRFLDLAEKRAADPRYPLLPEHFRLIAQIRRFFAPPPSEDEDVP
jgi:tetratricopeptide (TPR) repeat protein